MKIYVIQSIENEILSGTTYSSCYPLQVFTISGRLSFSFKSTLLQRGKLPCSFFGRRLIRACESRIFRLGLRAEELPRRFHIRVLKCAQLPQVSPEIAESKNGISRKIAEVTSLDCKRKSPTMVN